MRGDVLMSLASVNDRLRTNSDGETDIQCAHMSNAMQISLLTFPTSYLPARRLANIRYLYIYTICGVFGASLRLYMYVIMAPNMRIRDAKFKWINYRTTTVLLTPPPHPMRYYYVSATVNGWNGPCPIDAIKCVSRLMAKNVLLERNS